MTEKEAKDKLVDWCKSQVGYHEGYDGTNKYADGDWDTKLYGFSALQVPWCFVENTLVLTDKGYKYIQDVAVGDKVLSANGDNFNMVTNIANHEADVCDYRVYGTIPFSVTPNHRFLSEVRKDKWHRNHGFNDRTWNEISKLNKGDMISVPHTPKLFEHVLPYDDLWTVGYYCGDGYCSRRNEYVLCANDEKALKIEKHAKGYWDKDYSSRTCKQFNLKIADNLNLKAFLDECGHGAENKRVPWQILFSSKEDKRAFIDGFLAADGCESKHSFNSVSAMLVTGIARLLFDIGGACAINAQKRQPHGKIWDERLGEYRTFNQKEIIYNCIISTTTDEKHQDYICEGSFTKLPLRYIGETKTDMVYTVTTDGDHTYTANNLGVHNCDVFVDAAYISCFGFTDATAMTYQQPSGYAACSLSADAYKRNGAFYTRPEIGDQIFFFSGGGINHTGIVIEVHGDNIVCVEGNYSDSVCRTQYRYDDKIIAGYGRPNWAVVAEPESVGTNETFENVDDTQDGIIHPDHRRTYLHLQYGDGLASKGYAPSPSVRAWQALLQCWGYILDADGEFGFDTENATKQWQQKAQEIGSDVEVNGIVDEDDWKAVIFVEV